MRQLSFKKSSISFEVGLELQLIDPHSHTLISWSKELIKDIKSSSFQAPIRPEITHGMIEINSSIHLNPSTMMKELIELRDFLLIEANQLDIKICDEGTHPRVVAKQCAMWSKKTNSQFITEVSDE